MTLTDPHAVNAFNARIQIAPEEWSRPLREVIDTLDGVLTGMDQFGLEDPAMAVALTKLVLERHDAITYG